MRRDGRNADCVADVGADRMDWSDVVRWILGLGVAGVAALAVPTCFVSGFVDPDEPDDES